MKLNGNLLLTLTEHNKENGELKMLSKCFPTGQWEWNYLES